MSAQDLAFAELLQATIGWAGPGPFRDFLERSPISQPFLPILDAQRALVASAPPEGSAAAQSAIDLADADGAHDDAVRFLHAYLGAFAHHPDRAVAERARALRALLLPEGLELVNRSYAEEAGRAEARALALGPEVQAQLAAFPLPGGATLASAVERLQTHARQIGELLERRQSIGAASGPSPTELLNAKRALIAVVEQVLQSFRMVRSTLDASSRDKADALRDAWQRAVREASDRADARRRGEPETPPAVPPAT